MDDAVREMTGMSWLAVIERMEELTRKISCENSVRATTLEGRPTISRIRNMDMEQRNGRYPGDHPDQDDEVYLREP